MLDPSVLFAEDGFAWLEEQQDRGGIVIPATFRDILSGAADIDLQRLVAEEDVHRYYELRDRLAGELEGVETFSYRPVSLKRPHEEVLVGLLQSGDPHADLRADEWVFLHSDSMMLSKLRHPVEAFRDAGAVIVEYGRKTGRQLLTNVIPKEHLPPSLTPGLMARATAKWIVVGGAAIGGGTLGGLAGTAMGGPAGGWLGGKVGNFAASAGARACVLAIDP